MPFYKWCYVDEGSKKFMVINTHNGLYQYIRMPFGISSAPAIFQCVIGSILQSLSKVLCCLDEILITGATDQEHIYNLEEVLIDHKGLHTSPQKVAAIQDVPAPCNQQQLHLLLGLLRKVHSQPCHTAIYTPRISYWSQAVFGTGHQTISKLFHRQRSIGCCLGHYNPSLPLHLATDASAYGRGAHLSKCHWMANCLYLTNIIEQWKEICSIKKRGLIIDVWSTKVSTLFLC